MAGPVSDYLAILTTTSTKKVYRGHLIKFFDFIAGDMGPQGEAHPHTPEGLAELDAAAVAYLAAVEAGERKPGRDVIRFIAGMQETYAPSTVIVARAAVVGLLEDNDVELSHLDTKRIKQRTPRSRTVTEEETITHDHLAAVLPILTVRDRALALVLLSSGCRIGEALQLRLQDVDLERSPARITIRGETTKSKQRRISFLTPEAVEAVRAWLIVRSEYLALSARRNLGLVTTGKSKPKSMDDNRLFPFTRSSFDLGWEKALVRAGICRKCERTGRVTLRPHGLRKYFRTKLGGAAGPDLAETLMGHEGYLTSAYRRLEETELEAGYERHCHALAVTGGADLARQVADLRGRNDTLEAEMRDMKRDISHKNEMWEWFVNAKRAEESPH